MSRRGSAGVLEDFLAQMVVDDYADVAPAGERAAPGRGNWIAIPVLMIIGLLVAVAVISTRTSDDERNQTRTALAERVSAQSSAVADAGQVVEERQAEVDRLRSTTLELAEPLSPADLAALAQQAAATELSGPGISVTIDDAPEALAGSLNRVLDRDLQDIVNALWQMGAEGVAVNDQRLTATTAIRGAGDAILVNYVPLTRPYAITAVGTSTSGAEDSGLQALLRLLADDYGLVSSVATGDVALPAGEIRTPRFAEVASGGDEG